MNDTGNYPENVILEPGDRLEGIFRRLEKGTTRKGESRAIAILEVDGVERSLWLHETALRGKLRELRPDAGEKVAIDKGADKTESGNGYRYWPFKVTAPDRPVETPDWDSPLLGEAPNAADPDIVEPDIPIDVAAGGGGARATRRRTR